MIPFIITAFGALFSAALAAVPIILTRRENRTHETFWRPNVKPWAGRVRGAARAWAGGLTFWGPDNPPRYSGKTTRFQRGNPPTWRGGISPNAVGVAPSRIRMRDALVVRTRTTGIDTSFHAAGDKPIGWIGEWPPPEHTTGPEN